MRMIFLFCLNNQVEKVDKVSAMSCIQFVSVLEFRHHVGLLSLVTVIFCCNMKGAGGGLV